MAPQWASTPEVAPNRSRFLAAAVDDDGNVFAAGYQRGAEEFSYGNGASTTGGVADGLNAVVVSFTSDGDANWAQAAQAAEDDSEFRGLAVNNAGSIVAVGYLTGSGTYAFGNGVAVDGASDEENALLVSFNASGEAQGARTVSGVLNESEFKGVAANDSVYAVGFQSGHETFEYGNGVTATGKMGVSNAVIVRY